MAEVSKQVMKESYQRFVAAAEHEPCMQSCSADSTPIQVSDQVTLSLAQGATKRRFGKSSHEFLVAVQFSRRFRLDGRVATNILFRDPIPLTNGKKALQLTEAVRSQWKTLRQAGHRGPALQHYIFDRGCFTALERHVLQFHKLIAGQFAGEGRPTELCDLCEFILITACAAHDMHNAFKWSSPLVADKDLMKDMFIGCHACRNSFDVFSTYLAEWISGAVCYTEPLPDKERHQWQAVFVALGVHDTSLLLLLDTLEIRFSEGALRVSHRNCQHADVIGMVFRALMSLWKFRPFTESRWLSVGSAAKSMVAASLTGLSEFIAWVLRKPSVSGYYLNGFNRINNEGWKFLVQAAVVSSVADAGMAELLKDNRLASTLDAVKSKLRSSMQSMTEADGFMWAQFASVCGMLPPELRSACVRAGHKVIAFFRDRALSAAEGLPWSLCRGDISANLDALQVGPRPPEKVAAQLQDLLRNGYAKRELVRLVQLIGETPWTTAVVEQLHANAALLSRHHPDYALPTLLSRSMICMTNKLLPGPTLAQRKVANLQKAWARLRRKQPHRRKGRHELFKDLCSAAASKFKCKTALKWFRKKLMRAHADMFKKATPQQQSDYGKRAAAQAVHRRAEIERQKQDVLQQLKAARQEVRDESLARLPLSLQAARWADVEAECLARLHSSPDFAISSVLRLRDKACAAPNRMSDNLAAKLDSAEEVQPSSKPRPVWLAQVAQNREMFEGVAFEFELGGAKQAEGPVRVPSASSVLSDLQTRLRRQIQD